MYWHILKLHNDLKLPTRGQDSNGNLVDPEAAGWDLYAPEDGYIDALSRKVIPLGFKAEFTNGWCCKFHDKGGMGAKGIHHFGGLVESTYRGEWMVTLYNSTGETFYYKKGDRLIQAVFQLNGSLETRMLEVTSLTETGRGEGRFGSTGK